MIDLERGFELLVGEAGMTRYAIEKEAGMSTGSISKAIGYNDIKLGTLMKIADATGHTYRGKPSIRKLLKTMEISL